MEKFIRKYKIVKGGENMEKNTLLIYRNINTLKPTGGPNGYLYNLKKGFEELNIQGVEFLPQQKTNENKNNKIKEKIKSICPKFVYKIVRNYNAEKTYELLMNGEKANNNVDLNNYKYIHFHSTFEMYNAKDLLENYNGKVILTSHSPKPLYLEKIDNLVDKYTSKKNIEKFKNLEKVDEYAFNRADYIIFPCKEAEEPYYNQWDKYEGIKQKNKEKFRYMLTGIPKCKAKKSKEEIRKQYNIPQDAFLVSYVGRHNEVKGYDILKEIGNEILQNNNNIYVIVAGKEGPLYKLENKKWIEVGWTDDPHSIIASSDLFVLPNKETYFDLILLEVLSLGVPMLVSYTGGNKYFGKNYDDIGIKYFSNSKEAVEQIINMSNLDKNVLEELGKKNIKIYEQDFNEKIFARNYIELIKTLN